VVFTDVHISTREAFAGITPSIPATPLEEILALPVRQWQGRLINDFEGPVFAKYPELADVKKKLLAEGALYAAMSGSGSAVFGIFDQKIEGGFQLGVNA
jgi:4-diphosphocytidyl-2-C-methyl-D-erythritol kinase